MPPPPNAAAVSPATAASEQSSARWIATSDPASLVPTIRGALSFAGLAGENPRPVGGSTLESSMYVTASEQADAFSATSVARAVNGVAVSSATETVRPAANAEAEATTGVPLQSSLAYTDTVEPASASPVIVGALSFATA